MMHAAFILLAKSTDVYALAIVAVLVIAAVIYFSSNDSPAVEPVVEEPAPKPVEPALVAPEPTEPQFSNVQVLGCFLLLGGLGFGLIAVFMDVTVSTGRMTVNNIGLMNDRLMFFIAAGFAFLSGLLMMLLGGKK
jgi:hypothetical protein